MIVRLPRILPNASQKLCEKSQLEIDYYMLPPQQPLLSEQVQLLNSSVLQLTGKNGV